VSVGRLDAPTVMMKYALTVFLIVNAEVHKMHILPNQNVDAPP